MGDNTNLFKKVLDEHDTLMVMGQICRGAPKQKCACWCCSRKVEKSMSNLFIELPFGGCSIWHGINTNLQIITTTVTKEFWLSEKYNTIGQKSASSNSHLP